MSIWEQIVKDYLEAPKPNKKAGVVPNTHKRCSLCQKVKPRIEFYSNPLAAPNSVTSKCKPCHITYNNQRERELKGRRAKERAIRNDALATKAKEWEKKWSS